MTIPLSLAAAPPAAVQQSAGAKDDTGTIIVSAQRLEDMARALNACLARRCPPLEDISATLAHAEKLFLAGDYGQARWTLRDSRSRNERYSKTYPVEVADVTRAYARLTSLEGRSRMRAHDNARRAGFTEGRIVAR